MMQKVLKAKKDINTFFALYIKHMNNKMKKQLLEKVNRLSFTEHDEIFRILKSHKVSYTQNKNGVFFNLSSVDTPIILKIEDFVDYCIKNKKELDEYDKRINECKINNNYNSIWSFKPESDIVLESCGNTLVDNTRKDMEWIKLFSEIKSNKKVSSMIDILESNLEKLQRKKNTSKFLNAKKKFAKKISLEKKNDFEFYSNNLDFEQYLITI